MNEMIKQMKRIRLSSPPSSPTQSGIWTVTHHGINYAAATNGMQLHLLRVPEDFVLDGDDFEISAWMHGETPPPIAPRVRPEAVWALYPLVSGTISVNAHKLLAAVHSALEELAGPTAIALAKDKASREEIKACRAEWKVKDHTLYRAAGNVRPATVSTRVRLCGDTRGVRVQTTRRISSDSLHRLDNGVWITRLQEQDFEAERKIDGEHDLRNVWSLPAVDFARLKTSLRLFGRQDVVFQIGRNDFDPVIIRDAGMNGPPDTVAAIAPLRR